MTGPLRLRGRRFVIIPYLKIFFSLKSYINKCTILQSPTRKAIARSALSHLNTGLAVQSAKVFALHVRRNA